MLKVLVIDDETPIRQWLEFCVNRADGFEISGVASNGQEGVERFREDMPDIVVTDIEMPGVDGLEMLGQMQMINPNFYAIILTSHEDFSYARQAIKLGTSEYILKTEISDTSFLELLGKAAREIRDQQMTSDSAYEHSSRTHFLQGIAMKKRKFPRSAEEFRQYGITLEEQNLVAIVVWNQDSMLGTQELLRNLEGFDNMVPFTLGFDHVIALANIRAGEYQEILNSLPVQCEQLIGDNGCYLGISDVVDSFAWAEDIIPVADGRCNMAFYHPDVHVFYKSELKEKKLAHAEGYKVSFHKELLKQNYPKAIAVKNDVVRAVREEQPSDIDSVRKLFLSFVSSMLYFTRDDIAEIEKEVEGVTKLIQESTNLEKLLCAVGEIFDAFEDNIKKNNSFSQEIETAIQYMEEHYPEKITLSNIAGEVSFSPEYFSRLFMKETGVNFVVYLNNIRMKNAVQMLENTNLKVYEIAEKVGYSSLSYFSTAFKKKFGKNPYEYQLNAHK